MIIVTPHGIYTFDNLMDASALCIDLMDTEHSVTCIVKERYTHITLT